METKQKKDGDIERAQKEGARGEEIRQAKMVEVGAEGRERVRVLQRVNDGGKSGGPGGGAEHHVIVPWKSWAARRK